MRSNSTPGPVSAASMIYRCITNDEAEGGRQEGRGKNVAIPADFMLILCKNMIAGWGQEDSKSTERFKIDHVIVPYRSTGPNSPLASSSLLQANVRKVSNGLPARRRLRADAVDFSVYNGLPKGTDVGPK